MLFLIILLHFHKIHKILNILEKIEPDSLSISKLIHSKNVVTEMRSRSCFRTPFGINVLTVPKHCGSLEKSTFILPCHHSDIGRARKHPFLSELKS